MTERLYYDDSYLTGFEARVVERSEDGRRLCLSATAFYPESGGQPADGGWIEGVEVTGAVEEGDRIVHLMAAPVDATEVKGQIDWERRFDHMQQHTGQHLLSAVLELEHGISTVSFHMGHQSSTIDLTALSVEPEQLRLVEEQVNRLACENRPVRTVITDSSQVSNLRRPAEREGSIRVVTIEGLDHSACGGTHVRSTGEIGPVLLRGTEKVRGNVRLEFLCGMRALRAARRDFETLTEVARLFSAQAEETPALVSAQLAKLQDSEKARRRLAAELAQARGRELYAATPAGADGRRCSFRRLAEGALDEELRAEAQSFTEGPQACYAVALESPHAVLLAVSPDAGVNAGAWMKEMLDKYAGRGGGNARIAQGSLPSADVLEQFWSDLKDRLG